MIKKMVCLFSILVWGAIGSGCARYKPSFRADAPYFQRVKTQEQMQIRREGVAADIELKRLRTQAEIELKRDAQSAKQGGQG